MPWRKDVAEIAVVHILEVRKCNLANTQGFAQGRLPLEEHRENLDSQSFYGSKGQTSRFSVGTGLRMHSTHGPKG